MVWGGAPLDTGAEATRPCWSERRWGCGKHRNSEKVVQRVRNPSDQSRARQVGSEPCSVVGDVGVDA
jgi:hypothetical protein